MGARGNSGVIFSQIVRGVAEVLGGTEPVDVPTCTRALRGASDAAYRAVRRPVEGTMLTVIREMAEEAEASRADSVVELMHAVVRSRRGRARADAGAARRPARGRRRRRGRGRPARDRARARCRGRGRARCPLRVHARSSASTPSTRSSRATATAPSSSSRATASTPRRSSQSSSSSATPCSWSATEAALKVHVHTDEPGAALSLGTAAGTIAQVEIANMHEQTVAARGAAHRAAGDDPALPTSSQSSPVRGTGACSPRSALRGSSRAARR